MWGSHSTQGQAPQRTAACTNNNKEITAEPELLLVTSVLNIYVVYMVLVRQNHSELRYRRGCHVLAHGCLGRRDLFVQFCDSQAHGREGGDCLGVIPLGALGPIHRGSIRACRRELRGVVPCRVRDTLVSTAPSHMAALAAASRQRKCRVLLDVLWS